VKISTFALIIASLTGMSPSASSQNPDGAFGRGIPGYLDARTGAFKPMVQPPVESDQTAYTLAALSPMTGKLVFNFTVNVASSLPSSAVITCLASAQLLEMTSLGVGANVQEEAGIVAIRSGSKATCTVTMPYSWPLTTASHDKVTLGYNISAYSGETLLRMSYIALPSINVPTTGSTTS
jgi:hypothetical protein